MSMSGAEPCGECRSAPSNCAQQLGDPKLRVFIRLLSPAAPRAGRSRPEAGPRGRTPSKSRRRRQRYRSSRGHPTASNATPPKPATTSQLGGRGISVWTGRTGVPSPRRRSPRRPHRRPGRGRRHRLTATKSACATRPTGLAAPGTWPTALRHHPENSRPRRRGGCRWPAKRSSRLFARPALCPSSCFNSAA